MARREDGAVPAGEGEYAVQAVRRRDAARHDAMPELWAQLTKQDDSSSEGYRPQQGYVPGGGAGGSSGSVAPQQPRRPGRSAPFPWIAGPETAAVRSRARLARRAILARMTSIPRSAARGRVHVQTIARRPGGTGRPKSAGVNGACRRTGGGAAVAMTTTMTAMKTTTTTAMLIMFVDREAMRMTRRTRRPVGRKGAGVGRRASFVIAPRRRRMTPVRS